MAETFSTMIESCRVANTLATHPFQHVKSKNCLGRVNAYLAYFVAVPLRAAGRQGRVERLSWSIIDPLISLGGSERARERELLLYNDFIVI